MNIFVKSFVVVVSSFCLGGCIHFNFNNFDLVEFNVYKIGDTLIFQNQLLQKDTIIITGKNIERLDPAGNIWFRAMVANITFKDIPKNQYQETIIKHNRPTYQDASLLKVYKSDPWDIPRVEFYFKDFIGTLDKNKQRTNEFLKEYKEISYKITLFDLSSARIDKDITYIYWTESYGIIAYDTKNGDRWKLQLKNVP